MRIQLRHIVWSLSATAERMTSRKRWLDDMAAHYTITLPLYAFPGT